MNFKQIIKLVSTVSVFVLIAGLVVMGFFMPDQFALFLDAIAGFINQMGNGLIQFMPFLDNYGLGIHIVVVAWILVGFLAFTVLYHVVTVQMFNTIKKYRELKNDNQNAQNKNSKKKNKK